MCQRGRTGAHSWAQSIRRQAGAPSVQFSPVNLRNFTPVLTPIERCRQMGAATAMPIPAPGRQRTTLAVRG